MKKSILILAMLFLISLAFAACTAEAPEVPPEEPVEIEEEPEEEEEEKELGDITIAGTWVYVKATEGDDETPALTPYLDILSPYLDISEEGDILAVFYELVFRGRLEKQDEYSYIIPVSTLFSEGLEWEREGDRLRYDPARGLLRLTVPHPGLDIDLHYYFERGELPVFDLDALEPEEEEEPEPTPEPETGDVFSPVGRWVFVDSAETIYDFLSPELIVREDNTVSVTFYGTVHGILLQTGDHDFIILNPVLESEGMREYLDDEPRLSYNPQTGRLRYSRVWELTGQMMHFYFVRG